jgi:hypothetical protein
MILRTQRLPALAKSACPGNNWQQLVPDKSFFRHGKNFTWPHFIIMDKWLLLFVLLLLVTVALFLLGYFSYPFGIIILTVAILARLTVRR